MTFSHLGGMSIGSALPVVATAQASLAANVNLVLPDITARLAALLAASVSIVPPSLDVLAQITAALSVGLPSATIDLTAIASIIAELQAALAELQLQASFALALGGALSAGVQLYRWSGPASEAVPGGVVGLPSDSHVDGIFLVAGTGSAWSAIEFLLGE